MPGQEKTITKGEKILEPSLKEKNPMNILKYIDTVSNLYSDAPPPKSDAYYDGVVAGASPEQMKGLEERLTNARAFTGDPQPVGLGDNYKSDLRTPVQKKRDEFAAKKLIKKEIVKDYHKESDGYWKGQNKKTDKKWKYEDWTGNTEPPKRKFDVWKDGVKADKSPENIADIRKIINDDYKRNGLKYIEPEDRKYLDIKKEEPKTVYNDAGLSQLEALYEHPERSPETVQQYVARKEHEYKTKEHNRAIKTGIGTMFRINKIR